MNSLLKPIAGEWEKLSGTSNLTGAYCFVSMGEVLKIDAEPMPYRPPVFTQGKGYR